MDKKKTARYAMLKQMSSKKSSEMHEPVIGESLKKKKFSKLPPKEEEEAPLSKAQLILKAKLGEKLGLETEEEESEEELEHEEEYEEEDEEHDVKSCPVKDCALCNSCVSESKSEDEEAGEEE